MTNEPLKKKCLIVLGMHRSGTSALAGSLELTGFELGKNIMPPADENPKGFFENISIVDLNDKILEELYTFWNDTLFIPEGWWNNDKFQEFAARIKDILEEEFISDKPILIKDPRLCVLLPLHLEVLHQMGLEPVFVICVRNPVEVANSLKRRNNISMEKSFLIWMDYQFKAELYSRGLSRIFISYADFLQDPLKTLLAIIDSLVPDMVIDDQNTKEIQTFLDPSLSHQIKEERMTPVSRMPGLSEFYHLLLQANLRDLTTLEMNVIDRFRSEFTAMAKFYNGLPERYEAALTVDFANNEKKVLSLPITYGENILKFPVNQDVPVAKMVLRPCNARVGLKMNKIEALSGNLEAVPVEKMASSAGSKNPEGYMIFENDLPKIIIDFQPPVTLSQIEFSLDYLAFGPIANRRAMWKPGKI
jgi:hypothetical protein